MLVDVEVVAVLNVLRSVSFILELPYMLFLALQGGCVRALTREM